MLSSARSRRALERSDTEGISVVSLKDWVRNYRAVRGRTKRTRAHEDMRFSDGDGSDQRSAVVFNLISYEDDHYDKAHRA
jgi:hypothetical protein